MDTSDNQFMKQLPKKKKGKMLKNYSAYPRDAIIVSQTEELNPSGASQTSFACPVTSHNANVV